ncbi:MAG: hypothetical protein IJM90_01000 [Firmicutes bacterium]|nr:hypothetical protein [Bacillota bacterium]
MFYLALAGVTYRIVPLYGFVREYCRGYLTEPAKDAVSIEIVPEDIKYERERSESSAAYEGRPDHSYSDAYLETLAVYRQISETAPVHDTILFHGSAIEVDGRGYLFTAKSGTGKSTHTALWRQFFGERAAMINDDKPLLQWTPEGVLVWGTPWNGKHRLGRPGSAPLKGICVLERDTYNHIERSDYAEVLPMLTQQSYRPRQPEMLLRSMQLIDQIGHSVNLYKLGCNMDIEAARVSFEGMQP